MDPATRPEPGLATPSAVRYASYLMWAGAALQAVAAVMELLPGSLPPAVVVPRAVTFGVFSLVAIMFWRWSALFGKGSTAYFGQYRGERRMRRWVSASLARARRHSAPGSGR